MSDAIERPEHYNSGDTFCTCGRRIECIDVSQHWSFCLGNAIKYLWRCHYKGNLIEDLKKSVWYIQKEIERLEKHG